MLERREETAGRAQPHLVSVNDSDLEVRYLQHLGGAQMEGQKHASGTLVAR